MPGIDHIGYVQHDRAEMEMEMPFSPLAERYERKSVMMTSIARLPLIRRGYVLPKSPRLVSDN
jgi:hypothetical protein